MKSVAALLVSVVRLVLADLHSGAEAVRTEVEAAVSALDPDQTDLVYVISTTRTDILLTELQGHHHSQLGFDSQRGIKIKVSAQPDSEPGFIANYSLFLLFVNNSPAYQQQ